VPWPWLRLSIDDCDEPCVILNPAQARHLAQQLTDWADRTGDTPMSHPDPRAAITPREARIAGVEQLRRIVDALTTPPAPERPEAPEICELPHQTIDEEDDCERRRIAASNGELRDQVKPWTVGDLLEAHDVHRKALANAIDMTLDRNWEQLIDGAARLHKAASEWMADTEAATTRAETAARDADIYQKRLERLSKGYTEQRQRAETAEATIARIRALADWWDRAFIPGRQHAAELHAALHTPAPRQPVYDAVRDGHHDLDEPSPAGPLPTWTPPPPGVTTEQLPDEILAVINGQLPDYTSTACQTADAVACTATYRHPLYDELRAHAERLHARCRLNHKFTGRLCVCGCHTA